MLLYAPLDTVIHFSNIQTSCSKTEAQDLQQPSSTETMQCHMKTWTRYLYNFQLSNVNEYTDHIIQYLKLECYCSYGYAIPGTCATN